MHRVFHENWPRRTEWLGGMLAPRYTANIVGTVSPSDGVPDTAPRHPPKPEKLSFCRVDADSDCW